MDCFYLYDSLYLYCADIIYLFLLVPIVIANHYLELHCSEAMGITRVCFVVLVLICTFVRGNSIVEECLAGSGVV